MAARSLAQYRSRTDRDFNEAAPRPTDLPRPSEHVENADIESVVPDEHEAGH
jgi:hypothetical protein